MKRPRFRFLALGLLLAAPLSAATREAAFQARACLGPGVWSRVWRIANERAGPGSRYPAEFHGLVIAFADRLWLYTELDGTQTLSLYAGQLETDQADPGPLLRAVEPGLRRSEDVTDQAPEQLPAGLPPRACFIASMARWSQLQQEPAPPVRARLIAYFSPARRQGHMVLEYWRDGRRFVFDPDQPGKAIRLPGGLSEDPLGVARTVARSGRQRAPERAVPLELLAPPPAELARGGWPPETKSG